MEEEFTKQSKALYDAGIKGLQERIALIEEAADTKDSSLKDLSDFDMDQITKIQAAGFNIDKALDNRTQDMRDRKACPIFRSCRAFQISLRTPRNAYSSGVQEALNRKVPP